MLHDPIIATPTTTGDDCAAAYELRGHAETLRDFLDALDGRVTDHDNREGLTKAVVWPVWVSTGQEDLVQELRNASDRAQINLVIVPPSTPIDDDDDTDVGSDGDYTPHSARPLVATMVGSVEATMRRIAQNHGIEYDGEMTLLEFCLAIQARKPELETADTLVGQCPW